MTEIIKEFPLLTIVFLLFVVLILIGWISKKPVRGLYLTFFFTSILLAPNLPVVRDKISATEIIFIFTWFAMLIHIGSESIRTIPVSRNQKFSIFMAGVFIFWTFISFIVNNATYGAGFAGSLVEMVNYLYGYLMFVTVVIVVDDWEKWQGCIYAWVAGVALVSIFGVLALVGYGPEWAYDEFSGRVSSTLKFENQVPSFILPISLALIFMIAKRGLPMQKRLLLLVILIASFLTVIGTGSRIALIMVLISFLGVIFLAVKHARSGGFSPGILINLVVALIASTVIYISLALIVKEESYALGKTQAWKRPVVMFNDWIDDKRAFDEVRSEQLSFVIDNIGEHIFIGTGPKLSGIMYHVSEIHNTYAAILLESGLFGLLFFLWWIWGVIRNGWLAGKKNHVPFQRLLILSMVIGMLILLLYNMTMFGLRQRNIWLLAGLLIAATSIYRRQINDSYK